jgi:helix-turn-helix protein
VTIGEALAGARNKAGLSIDEVSERTRIRETVIRDIEQDDYAACGGDLYVRGYVRVIASVVGIDAQPLIREYDLAHSGQREPPTTIDPVPPGLAPQPMPPQPMPPQLTLPQPLTSEPPTLIDSIIPGLEPIEPFEPAASEPVRPEPVEPEPFMYQPATSESPVTPGMITPELVASEPLTPQSRPPLVTAASRPPSAPGPRSRPRRPGPPNKPAQPTWKARKHGRRWVAGIAALAIVVLAAVGFAGSRIVSGLRHSAAKTTAASSAAAGRRGASASPGTAKPSVATKGSGTKAATSPATAPAPNPAVPPPSTPLHVAVAEAFGPDGVGDGDNPQVALYPITPGASSPWQTDWYTTPDFGRLKQGTGLLLDMGQRATITSVRIALGSAAGADLQLRVGDTPALADLPVVASASDADGTVSLSLAHAVRAQYVLIWFTLLPPNGAGQYQVSVYQVRVSGQS